MGCIETCKRVKGADENDYRTVTWDVLKHKMLKDIQEGDSHRTVTWDVLKRKEYGSMENLSSLSFIMLLLIFLYSDYQELIRLDNCKVIEVMELFDEESYFVEEGELENFSEVEGEYWTYQVYGRSNRTCVKSSKIYEGVRKEKRFDDIGDKVRITYVYQEQNEEFIREIIRLEVFDEDANMKNN